MSTVVTRDLTKAYGGRVVVDHLTLDLQEGEVFGLLGPNGAGKTTTILMLLGLTEPTSGGARVLGLDPRRSPLEVKSQVGYLPDAVGFYDSLTGRENLRFTARLNRLGADTDERIDTILDEVGLSDAADQEAGTYSRGMRQRLGIADALLKNPKILILDEPTTAIDPEGVQEILGMIRRLADDRGVTVLLSSHLLHQVQTVCDRVAIFVRGKVVAMGTPHELASSGDGPEQVLVTVDGHGNPGRVFEETPFVVEATPDRVAGVWKVTVQRGSTTRLVEGLVEAGVGITAVHRLTDDLDEVYRRFFDKEAAHV